MDGHPDMVRLKWMVSLD